MEHIVASLIQNYDEGKISRRQLIKTLTLAAGGASVGGSVPAYAAEVGKAIGIRHISYEVADYARTRDFYVGLFGMKATNGKDRCTLTFGDVALIARTASRNQPGVTTPRFDHISYTIANFNSATALAELKRRGLNPQPEGDGWLIKDPDGSNVAMTGKPAGSGD